jgi:hypothetical protein
MRSRQVLDRLLGGALAPALAAALLAGGCGGPSSGGVATAPAYGPLASTCGADIQYQLSWYPEGTQGGAFAALGGNIVVNRNKKSVTGDLYDQGKPTGVRMTLRSGGPAVDGQQASELMRLHPEILIGQEASDDVMASWVTGTQTVMVLAPFQVDPVVYIWDRKQHPEWNTIQDIGQSDYTVFTFKTAQADYLVGNGILRARQMNTSYDGSPTHLMEKRDAAVGGFSTNEVYLYQSLGVDVGYDYVSNAGFPNYRNTAIVRKEDIANPQKRACFAQLIPILQRSNVAFMANPDPTLRMIVDLDKQYPAPYTYPMAQAQYGVKIMRQDGLVANGSDGVFGSLSATRLNRVLHDLTPVWQGRRQTVPGDLNETVLFDNQFLDKHIRLQEPR